MYNFIKYISYHPVKGKPVERQGRKAKGATLEKACQPAAQKNYGFTGYSAPEVIM